MPHILHLEPHIPNSDSTISLLGVIISTVLIQQYGWTWTDAFMSILIAVLIFVRCCEKFMCSGQEPAMMCDLFSISKSLSLCQPHLLLTRTSVIPLVKETALVLLQCTPPELLDGSKRLSAKVIISKLLQTLTFYVTSNTTRHTSHVTRYKQSHSHVECHTSHATWHFTDLPHARCCERDELPCVAA
jgi:Co/Zn/Cd efflux system component